MRIQTSLLVAFNAALISCAPLSATPNIVPTGVTIGPIAAAGTGCVGDATWIVASNQSTVYFSTPSFKGLSSDTSDDRNKSCKFTIPVTYPAGFQYQLSEFSLSGHHQTPSDSSASVGGFPYLSGQDDDAEIGIGFPGGTEGEYTQGFGFFNDVWSPCGAGDSTQATGNLKTRLNILTSAESGNVSIETAVLQLGWRTC